MQIVGRSYQYTPDPESSKDNNWANHDWLKVNQPEKLVMKELRDGTGYFMRTQDYLYDIPRTPDEQYILCYHYYIEGEQLSDLLYNLQSRGYMVFFNSVYTQSVPEIRHGHIIKF